MGLATKKKRAAEHVGLGDPARYTAAECFYLREREKYLEECHKNYPNDDDAHLLKRFQKWAAQQGHNLLKDSESFREEVEGHVGAEPYSREISYKNKIAFIVRGVVVGGEATDALIPADFLLDPENDFELRRYVEKLTGDPVLVQKWSDQAARVGNVWLRFRRASKGAADQGRPRGKSDARPRRPRARRPDVVAFRPKFYRRYVAAEKAGAEQRGLETRILERMAREEQMTPKVESLRKRLYRP